MRRCLLLLLLLALAGAALGAPSGALAGSYGACTITGTNGDDTLVGTPGDDVICGLDGNDTIYGMGGNDVLVGGSGNDVLHGGDGCDELHAGAGDDTLYGDTAPSGCMDRLNGDTGNDTLVGGTGADDLNGGPGFNDLSGGDGVDYVDYSCHVGSVVATLGGTGTDAVMGTVDTLHTDIENVIGGMGDDTLTGDDAANSLNGGPGGNDTLNGMGGNDRLSGGYWESRAQNCAYRPTTTLGDADMFNGGDGIDQVTYGDRSDPVSLVIGGGPVSGDAALGEHDTIASDVEQVFGGHGNDVLTGDDNANFLNGGPAGDDTIFGMGGDDTIVPGPGNDTVDGGAGRDVVRASGDAAFIDHITCDAFDVVRHDAADVLSGC